MDQTDLPRASVILSSNIGGTDACNISITSANCTYDLVIGPLSSALIAGTSYQIAGVTFNSVNRTRGLPYDILQQFVANSSASRFADAAGHYCLPSLDEHMVSCERDTSNSRVIYSHRDSVNGMGIDTVTINPNSVNNDTRVRVNYQNGTMTIAQSRIPGERNTTIITGSGIYADLLSQLTYGPNVNSSKNIFTVVCTIKSVRESVTWRWTRLLYANNTFRAEVPDTTFSIGHQNCGNSFAKSVTGFIDLPFAIEGATRLVNSADGNTKYINLDVTRQNWNLSSGTNMTHLEFILTQLYEITQTMWSSVNPTNSTLTSIIAVTEEHRYRIHTSWTLAVILPFLIASLVFVSTIWQAFRWKKFQQMTKTAMYNLLDPLELLTYGVDEASELQRLYGSRNFNPSADSLLPKPTENTRLGAGVSYQSHVVEDTQPLLTLSGSSSERQQTHQRVKTAVQLQLLAGFCGVS